MNSVACCGELYGASRYEGIPLLGSLLSYVSRLSGRHNSTPYLIMASNANTFEQHPPKISTIMLNGPKADTMVCEA